MEWIPSFHHLILCVVGGISLSLSLSSIVGPLGSGHFGLVNMGQWRDPFALLTHQVAIKSLSSGSEQLSKIKFLQEAAIMAQFKHPNVVHLFGSVVDGDSVSFFNMKCDVYDSQHCCVTRECVYGIWCVCM